MFETVLAKAIQVVDASEALSLTGSGTSTRTARVTTSGAGASATTTEARIFSVKCWMQVRDLIFGHDVII
jgi:cytoskeletal protein RodZ